MSRESAYDLMTQGHAFVHEKYGQRVYFGTDGYLKCYFKDINVEFFLREDTIDGWEEDGYFNHLES